MEVKEAIKILQTYINCKGWSVNIEDFDVNEFNEIIALLQQGEKYRQMWEEFGDLYCFNCIDLNENKNSILETRPTKYKTIHTLMLMLEQKYFLKE